MDGVAGAHGLAALWLTSTQILGVAHPGSAVSGFTQRPEVAAELLLLGAGWQLRRHGPVALLRPLLSAQLSVALTPRPYVDLLACGLLLRPWWDPEGCGLPQLHLASALLPCLAVAGPLKGLLDRLERKGLLSTFGVALWLVLLVPVALDVPKRIAWAWPAANVADLMLGERDMVKGSRPVGATEYVLYVT